MIKQCAFVTFAKYTWATKCYPYRQYITFQKSNMATEKATSMHADCSHL